MDVDLFSNVGKKAEEGPARAPLLPHREMGAYEALWLRTGATFKSISEAFKGKVGAVPSDFVSDDEAQMAYQAAMEILRADGVPRFGIRVHGAGEYPERLRDAKEPVELFYFQGSWEFVDSNCIAIVGTRKPSPEGVLRTEKLARLLVENNFTVVSGLAAGVDTAAHTAAIKAGGRTISVIGTPIGKIYPKQNTELQKFIAQNHLLISQVPIVRYSKQQIPQNRLFFPERNKTMSALTKATVIVEAGETSGTLIQARAALHQGRKLFLMDSLFNRPDLTWPQRFEAQGAIRIKSIEDILEHVR